PGSSSPAPALSASAAASLSLPTGCSELLSRNCYFFSWCSGWRSKHRIWCVTRKHRAQSLAILLTRRQLVSRTPLVYPWVTFHCFCRQRGLIARPCDRAFQRCSSPGALLHLGE